MVRYEKELEMTQTLNSIDLDIVKTLLARAARTLDVLMTMCHFNLLSTFVLTRVLHCSK